MMERDRRLTGSLRGQSVRPGAHRSFSPATNRTAADLTLLFAFADGADRTESVCDQLGVAD